MLVVNERIPYHSKKANNTETDNDHRAPDRSTNVAARHRTGEYPEYARQRGRPSKIGKE